MKIAIIGAGFTGLSAGYTLSKKGHSVTLFEKDDKPGGLAVGYQEKNWEWSLEKHYHHWFTNDTAILNLAQEIGTPFIINRPKTSIYSHKTITQLDSPLHVLLFSQLSLLQRIRMAFVLGFLKINPLWKPLERFKASSFLKKSMGEAPYKLIWEPQLKNKFGKYYNTISLAWFWARIHKRTPSLAYPQKGFLFVAEQLGNLIRKNGGKILFSTTIASITSSHNKFLISYDSFSEQFDCVIVTIPMYQFLKLCKNLPETYKTTYQSSKGLAAINMVIRLKKPFFADNTYWLSICDTTSPIMAIVEHTNFINKSHYGNEHLLYLGNYLETTDKRFTMSDHELYKLYRPFLEKINPSVHEAVISYKVFKAPFAQPIIPPNYSHFVPSFTTPIPNLFLANIEQVYPWDRGTNYAVALGEKVAAILEQENASKK